MKRGELVFLIVGLVSLALGFLVYLIGWSNVFTYLQHKYYQLINVRSNVLRSKIEKHSYISKALDGSEVSYQVYVPDAYNKGEALPVLYLLHGYPGDDSDWLINGNLQTLLDEWIYEGKIAPLLVVFPDGSGPVVEDSQYLNATEVSQNMESAILELVTLIDNTYKTKTDRNDRAIAGISSGGYGAVNIGLHSNALFSKIISMSGYFINEEGVTNDLLGSNDDVREVNNPLQYTPSLAIDPQTVFYLGIGTNDDEKFVQETKLMAEELNKKGLAVQLNLTKGGHDWALWKSQIKSALTWLGNTSGF